MIANRFDRIDAPDWATSPLERTDDGSLHGRACITNIGIFRYRLADGSMQYELRHPDDVFKQDSMDSLKNKPITNGHPGGLLTEDNVAEFKVGSVGDNPSACDNIHLVADILIQDKRAINDIEAGKQELSAGYTCDVVDESGVWLGMPYTKRQKNIVYNHVAVVEKTRAGEAARIRMDAADGEMVTDTADAVSNKKESKEEPMADLKKVKLDDGVEYEAEAAVIATMNKAQAKADALDKDIAVLKADKSKTEAERDSYKEKFDAAEKKLDERKDCLDSAQVEALIQKRLALIAVATKAEVEIKADMAEKDIVAGVILKVFPSVKLDGRDEAYIAARYDCAKEDL